MAGKIIFLDIDMTLVGRKGTIPEFAVSAVRAARAAGNRVYACTGRCKAEMYQPIWEMGLDGMIGGNGAYVEDDGQAIYDRNLDPAVEREQVDWLVEKGIGFYLETNPGLYCNDLFFPKLAEHVMGACTPATLEQGHKGFPLMIETDELYRDDVKKISFLMEDFVDLDELARHYKGRSTTRTWGVRSDTHEFGEFGQVGITKSAAVAKLLEHLGETREDTIAFGDSTVDIDMFELCGYSVAMGNASEDCKAAADYVTDDVDEDGLARAFEKLGLAE